MNNNLYAKLNCHIFFTFFVFRELQMYQNRLNTLKLRLVDYIFFQRNKEIGIPFWGR